MARTWKALGLSPSAWVAFSAHWPAPTISPRRQIWMLRLSRTLERWRAFSRTTSLTSSSSLSSAYRRASTPASIFIVGWGRAWAISISVLKIDLHQSGLSLITREGKHSKMGCSPKSGTFGNKSTKLGQADEHRRTSDRSLHPLWARHRDRGRIRCDRLRGLRLSPHRSAVHRCGAEEILRRRIL